MSGRGSRCLSSPVRAIDRSLRVDLFNHSKINNYTNIVVQFIKEA